MSAACVGESLAVDVVAQIAAVFAENVAVVGVVVGDELVAFGAGEQLDADASDLAVGCIVAATTVVVAFVVGACVHVAVDLKAVV